MLAGHTSWWDLSSRHGLTAAAGINTVATGMLSTCLLCICFLEGLHTSWVGWRLCLYRCPRWLHGLYSCSQLDVELCSFWKAVVVLSALFVVRDASLTTAHR
jgi:hypothetical protein